MTELIAHHPKTSDLALFCSEGKYWIGSYNAFLSHTTEEPPYVFVRGYFQNERQGLVAIGEMTGDEF